MVYTKTGFLELDFSQPPFLSGQLNKSVGTGKLPVCCGTARQEEFSPYSTRVRSFGGKQSGTIMERIKLTYVVRNF